MEAHALGSVGLVKFECDLENFWKLQVCSVDQPPGP